MYKNHWYLVVFFYMASDGDLPSHFTISRSRVAFSAFLVFIFELPRKFYSTFKKKSWKKTKIFWSKIDFEILIEKIRKFSKLEIFDFSIFDEKLNFSMKNSKIQNFSIFRFFENFRNFQIFIENPMKISIFENFRKFSDQNFKIDFRSKNFDLFPWTFF